MKKIKFTDFSLGVTQKCNMYCAHCLRGPARNVDISNELIDKLANSVDTIASLTFTGGEPSLNTNAIDYTYGTFLKNKIMVNTICCITNGKDIDDSFIDSLSKWADYTKICNKNTRTLITISQDEFHEPVDDLTKKRLAVLPFSVDSKKIDYTKEGLIYAGNAKQLSGDYNIMKYVKNSGPSKIVITKDNTFISGNIYLSAEGFVYDSCDVENGSSSHKIGNLMYENLYDIFVRYGEERNIITKQDVFDFRSMLR